MTSRDTRRIRFNGRDFLEAGLNVTDNPLIVPPNQMVEALNILVGSTLARKKRGGQAYFNTDSSDAGATYPVNPKNNGGVNGTPILGAYEFWRYDAGTGAPKSTLMVRQGNKIWGINARTGVATNLTGALVLPTDGHVFFQAFEGRVYWTGTGKTGGTEGYHYWDGVAAAAVAAAAVPPDGTPTHILSHGGRMWAWGVPGFPYRLYYSAFYNAESWSTTAFGTTGAAAIPGSLDLDPFGDPFGISAGVSYQDRLYMFMNRAQFKIDGNQIDDFVVTTLNRKIGCIGQRTIVPTGNDVIYASERGILRLSSTQTAMESESGFISREISKIWNESIDRTKFAQYSAVYDEQDNLYLLSVPSQGSTGNDLILAFNAQSSLWCGAWVGHKARSLANYVISGRNRVIAGREDGIISVLGEATRLDLGVAYTAKFKTGFVYPGEEIDIEHIWKHATILASTNGSGNLTLNAYVDTKLVSSQSIVIDSGSDLLGTTFILGQSTLGSGVFVPQTVGLKGQGYGLQLEVIFNTDDDVEVFGFMVEAKPAGSPVRGGMS